MSSDSNKIFVTKPVLPPLEEFVEYLKEIWESKQLTNNGPFHQKFEKALCDYLGVKYISLFNNGTMALVTALQALRITGEVITTPFSFVATTHALWWNNIKPVFVDIEPDYFTLDPDKIESAITPKTTAILPVHVYGNPCRVEEIKKIADTYGLKVIYDACHTFGVRLNGVPVLNFGDLSVMSFHGTKVFTTFEGGAIVCHDEATKKRIDFLKNFGFADETTVVAPGINAKMNEFQAALGLLQLKYIDEAIEKRKKIAGIYRNGLKNIPGLKFLEDIPGVKHCYSYFPVLIDQEKTGMSRDSIYEEMKTQDIYTRRYFYPLISQFPAYRSLDSAQPGKMPVAEKVTEEVICLPIYPDLDDEYVNKICTLLNRS
jgi:dTDP-4-amino-4,6-dideoxygalactose transaminase